MDILTEDQKGAYLRTLIDRTENGRIRWQSSPAHPEHQFYARLRHTTVWIYSRDNDDFHPYELSVDEFDPAVDIMKAKILFTITSDPDNGGRFNQYLESLYVYVKRTVLRLDDLGKKVFDDLDDL